MPFSEGVPTVAITLAGRVYLVGWTWAAKRRARDYFVSQGKDEEKVTHQESIAAAIWAGMEEETRRELSVADVEEMIHPRNEVEVLEKMGSLWEKSEPDPDPKTSPVAVREPTTGNNSSESGRSESLTLR